MSRFRISANGLSVAALAGGVFDPTQEMTSDISESTTVIREEGCQDLEARNCFLATCTVHPNILSIFTTQVPIEMADKLAHSR